MIVYPLPLPTKPNFNSITLRMQSIVGQNRSPFTGQLQTYQWPGEWWEADLTLPPIRDIGTAENWIAFLAALRGLAGTFPLGDPLRTVPLGNALGSPLIAAASYSAAAAQSPTLALSGFEPNVPNILLPGDYVEVCNNFLTNPSDFTQPNWTKGGANPPTLVALAIGSAADGLGFASSIAFGAVSSISQVVVSPPLLRVGTTFTFGIWLKAASDVAVTLAIVQTIGSGPGSVTIATQSVNVGTDWGFFEVSGAMLNPAGGALAVSISGASVTVQAWGASLDDGLSGHRLHKNVTPADSDSNGNVTLDIWPVTRAAYPEAAPINLQTPRGTFCLASNTRQWSVDAAKVYGIAFKAVEAI